MKNLICYFDEVKNKYTIIDENGSCIHEDEKLFYVIKKFFTEKSGENIYFRGQSSMHELLPSILRDDYIHLLDNYDDYVKKVKIDHHIELLECNDNELKILSKMQHYGFPTNLLDITSPYKALGFMTEAYEEYDEYNPPCIYVFEPKDNSSVILSTNLNEAPDKITTIIPNNNQMDNIRLHAQSGLFVFTPIKIRKANFLTKLEEKYIVTKLTVKYLEVVNKLLKNLIPIIMD